MDIKEYIISQGYRMIMTNQKDIEVLESTFEAGVIVLLIHKEKKSYSTELVNQLQEAMKAQFELKGLIIKDFLTIIIEDQSSYYKNRDLEAECDSFWIVQLDKALLSFGIGSRAQYYGLEELLEQYLSQLPKKNRIKLPTQTKKEELMVMGVERKIEEDEELGDRDDPQEKLSTYRQSQEGTTSRRNIPKAFHQERKISKATGGKLLEVPNRFLRYKQRMSLITFALIGINILVFIYLEFIGDTQNVTFMLSVGAANAQAIKSTGGYSSLITSMFLHFGWGHLVNNMLVLFFLGTTLEKAIGHLRFLVIYLVGGVAGSLLSYQFALTTNHYYVSAGASGCIFAVVGTLFYIVLRNKGRFEDLTLQRMILMLVFSIYSGIYNAGVDNMAHLGGFVGGLFLGILLYRKKPNIRRRKQ